jgi:ABC-2 type transport system permease protein
VFVSGIGIFRLGIVPSANELSRLIVWVLFAIVYVAFWQALATLGSVVANRASTSALVPIGIWVTLSLFGPFLFGAIADVVSPDIGTPTSIVENARTEQFVSQISPITLFQQGSTVLLDPEVRSTGLLTFEQVDRAIVT